MGLNLALPQKCEHRCGGYSCMGVVGVKFWNCQKKCGQGCRNTWSGGNLILGLSQTVEAMVVGGGN